MFLNPKHYKMKYLLLIIISIVLGISCKKDCEDPPDPQPECKPDLTKGLLAYYPFNGNFNDESGNGNHAVAKNGAFLTTDFIGRTNGSAGFDGINDYLIVAGNSKLNADTITISFQVMVNSMNRRHATISRINFETAESLI